MKPDWIECVQWCHAAEAPEAVEALIETLTDLGQRSKALAPILTKSRNQAGIRAAGYLVLYPGSLASIGNLRSESNNDEELEQQMLAELAKDLFQEAFDSGAELVQAISPLIASHVGTEPVSAFASTDPRRDGLLRAAGMVPVAILVQMECSGMGSIAKREHNAERKCAAPEFISHFRIPSKHWRELIERTYVDTLDVPELNGRRDTRSTLEGYASTIVGVPQTWWAVQVEGVPIGCAMLTPTTFGSCELTYLGLVPESRGKGHSKAMMNWIRDWALQNGVRSMTLAVDLRNTPAIRLYRSCGFITERFVQAWIAFPVP
jgi:GNAT superfamily N-acetyltransferase